MCERTERLLRRASAIARLHYLRMLGVPCLCLRNGQESISMIFRNQGPLCRCCGKPMDRRAWLRSVIGPCGPEIVDLLRGD